jgi:hypothetical protein
VVLIGDEKYQTPSYVRRVRAVFKTGGTRPNPLGATVRLAPAVAWRVLLREGRNTSLAVRRGTVRGPHAPMFEIPMGVFGLRAVDWVPFDERATDVFFAGSIEDDAGFTLRPRLAARRQMAAALDEVRRESSLHVDCTTAGPFANPGDMLDQRTYSERLMRSKIALCPRGNFDETFRLSEAAKSGCVAVTEHLPARWYYRGAPAVELRRWRELPETLERLLADPEALSARAMATRQWWTDRLSERSTAAFIAGALARAGLLR